MPFTIHVIQLDSNQIKAFQETNLELFLWIGK